MITFSRVYLILCSCLYLSINIAIAQNTSPSTLPIKVQQALKKANIGNNNISVSIESVQSIANGKIIALPILAFNADKFRNPASIMKIVTSVSAFEHFGSNYTWNTPFYHANTFEQIKNKGVMDDKIYIDLQADPKWIPETTLPMLQKWRTQGIHSIQADFILDNTVLATKSDNALQGDAVYATNPLADNFAFNSITLTFNAKDVNFTYPIYGIDIQNNLRATQTSCPSNKSWSHNIQSSITQNTSNSINKNKYTIHLSGSYSENCQNKSFNIATINTIPSKDFLVSSILGLWQSIGGKVLKSPQISYGNIPKNSHLIANIVSEKLSDLVVDMNKFSNNLMARLIFLNISKNNTKGDNIKPLNVDVSKNMVFNILKKQGISIQNMVIENGSGLSRIESISSSQMVAILKQAMTKIYFQNLLHSLPIIGVDGTMKSRLQDMSGKAWIKTGTLNNVKSIAGYIDNGAGGYTLITAIINDKNAHLGDVALDELVRWARNTTQN